MINPSWRTGCARHAAESANPGLWDRLIGAWVPALGHTGSLLRDASGRCQPGTKQGTSSWVYDDGLSINFAGGKNDYYPMVGTKEALVNQKSMTAVVRAKPDDTGSDQRLAGSQPDLWWIWCDVGGSGVSWAGGVSTYSGNPSIGQDAVGVSTTKQDLVVLTYDMTIATPSLDLYVDGEHRAATTSATGKIRNWGPDCKLGAWAGVDGFDGPVSMCLVYNRALSYNEIKHLAHDYMAPFRLRKPVLFYAPTSADSSVIQSANMSGGLQTLSGGML